VRSRRNLSYAVDAPLLERGRATGGLYVTTVAPEQTLGIMRDEISRLQTDLIPASGLDQLVQQFITNYFLENETNAEQATFLAKAQIYRGDYRAADRFMAELRAVTPEDVRRVARTYIRGINFAYVGDTTKVSRPTLRRF
jgi:zinc protease